MSYRRGKTIGRMVTSVNIKPKQSQADTFLGSWSPGMRDDSDGQITISQHKSSIDLGNDRLPVSKHFIDMGHKADQLKFIVLEGIPPFKYGGNRELKVKNREVWWIHKLNT
ncbi:hypothetical protein XELAEV_18017057mg [Xenopus laevis]|uniref:Uncharacterized protein n=1 Tax=Xenopus laevis TaxID=8355 RepID=A0A974HSM3_XENLA|nr:hypothetical protein XELAEV_18017057mg [Xenopus laevis]